MPTNLARGILVVQDEDGTIVDGASIEVRDADSLVLVQVYPDRIGADPALGNPFIAADGADIGFYVASGSYNITATKDAFTRTWERVPLGTAAEYSIEEIYDSAPLTGTPTAPTASQATNNTQIATTAYVRAAITAILNGVSAAFDTLAEIATELALKAYIASPTFTGTPASPTASPGTNTTQIATTAFVQAAATGAIVLIQTQSFSAQSVIDFTTGLNDTYDAFEFRISNLKVSVDGASLYVRIGTGGGPTYQAGASDYQWVTFIAVGTTASATGNNANNQMVLTNVAGSGIGNAAGESYSGVVRFDNPEVSDFCNFLWSSAHTFTDGLTHLGHGAGKYLTAGAITGIRFLPSSGTFSGRISLYAYKKA